MSEEIDAIFNSIRSINNNSNKSQWIVEAIIPSPELTESIYSTLGCFDDYKSANSYCIELTEKVPYNFISFRVKKLGIFMNFINCNSINVIIYFFWRNIALERMVNISSCWSSFTI